MGLSGVECDGKCDTRLEAPEWGENYIIENRFMDWDDAVMESTAS